MHLVAFGATNMCIHHKLAIGHLMQAWATFSDFHIHEANIPKPFPLPVSCPDPPHMHKKGVAI